MALRFEMNAKIKLNLLNLLCKDEKSSQMKKENAIAIND